MSRDLTPDGDNPKWPWKLLEVGDYFFGPRELQSQVSNRSKLLKFKLKSEKVSREGIMITRMPDNFIGTRLQPQIKKVGDELDTLIKVRGGYKVVYPWATMEVGQCFRLNVKSRGLVHVAAKQHNRKFRTEDIPLIVDVMPEGLEQAERLAKIHADKLLPRFIWVIRMPDDYVPLRGYHSHAKTIEMREAATRPALETLEWRTVYGMHVATTSSGISFQVLRSYWQMSPDFKRVGCVSVQKGKEACERLWKQLQLQQLQQLQPPTKDEANDQDIDN